MYALNASATNTDAGKKRKTHSVDVSCPGVASAAGEPNCRDGWSEEGEEFEPGELNFSLISFFVFFFSD